jgi:kynurenine formamidase
MTRERSKSFVEVSHSIMPGMKTYPGLPEPQAEVLLDYEASRGVLRGTDVSGRAVLFRTDFSKNWATTAYFSNHPFLAAETCEQLVAMRPAFVGIDSLNIDDTGDPSRPAHSLLLRAGIPVCEHMTNLEAIPSGEARLHAVPIAWLGGATFPVRAYVIVGG